MRTLSASLVLAVVVAVVPPPVEAQCRLFATDGTCPSGPRIHVDFGPGLQSAPATEAAPVQQPLHPAPDVRRQSEPIDCRMARTAPQTLDPGFARRPAAGVTYSMRVTVVPSCPAR